jgi:hypothetical protein
MTATTAAALAARTLEDDEDREVLVGAEAMVGAGFDENRVALLHRHWLAFDLEHAASLEDDVDLVVLVRLLVVGLRGDEDVDAELEARRLVDDLVAAARGAEPLDDAADPEGVHGADVTRRGAAGRLRPRW